MPVRFLLGPAGSGKTHRCLAEIRAELLRQPDGPPLLFLAPKQATYQLERQLLEDPGLPGWTRLQILSFDRLARFVLAEARPVQLLGEEGRLMVLRALVRRLGPQLRVFHASARLAGFAQELSTTLRELRNFQLGPDRLLELAETVADDPSLGRKLHDLALLLRAYGNWLRDHQIEDADSLPDLATEHLRKDAADFRLDALWLDGFAEMTPQELELLAAVARHTRQVTLAFCLEAPPETDPSWLSPWSVVTRTFRQCHARLAAPGQPRPILEILPAPEAPTRFHQSPALAHLAAAWTQPRAAGPAPAADATTRLRLVACRDPEAEVVLAARTLLRHVRRGGRFRDAAVVVRGLEPYQASLERVFARYDIPYFLDRRETLAHHPLAELTRSALRLAAFDWAHDDWFGALKTDLAGLPASTVDTLENEALARGWDGRFWRSVAEDPERLPGPFGPAVARAVGPFADLARHLRPEPNAHELATGLRTLWDGLGIRRTLERWTDQESVRQGAPAPHVSAWDQLEAWLKDLERGFSDERLPLAEWLPILEAGLSSLTAGVIPSSQDQVVVGAIDRSRQPDLRLAIVLGLNEGRFPAPPRHGGMLTDDERTRLGESGADFGAGRRHRIGHERYLAYVACTRARDALVLCWSQRDETGTPLNPSPFLGELRTLFPDLEPETDGEEWVDPDTPLDRLLHRLVHPSELLPWLLARDAETPLDPLSGDAWRRAWLRRTRSAPPPARIPPSMASALHGPDPELSVSALECLGACPFQYLVRFPLRGRERERFESDGRTLGSLAHELLARFHQTIRARNLQWRDVPIQEAGVWFDQVTAEVLPTFSEGICTATATARWQSELLVAGLRAMVLRLVAWAPANAFDPFAAELAFGTDQPLPPWRIPIGPNQSLRVRGKVDRVDLLHLPDGTARFLVIDYKLRRPSLQDPLILAGVDLQLAAYALAFAELTRAHPPALPVPPAQPAGIFYIGLRGRADAAPARHEAPTPDEERAGIHRHRGRFAASALDALDRGARGLPSGQFAFALKQDGSLRKGGDGREDAEFEALLHGAEEAIRGLATRLFDGDVSVAPFARGRTTACDRCDFQGICRFDGAIQPFRRLPK